MVKERILTLGADYNPLRVMRSVLVSIVFFIASYIWVERGEGWLNSLHEVVIRATISFRIGDV